MECISFEEKGGIRRALSCREQKKHSVYQSDSHPRLNSRILAKLKNIFLPGSNLRLTDEDVGTLHFGK